MTEKVPGRFAGDSPALEGEMAQARPTESDATWGDLVPARECEWRSEDDKVSLLVPRFGRGRLGRKLEQWIDPQPYEVHLDDIGTFVWKLCDGSTRVAEIAGRMREHFGERVEPVEERLVTFLRQLLYGRFIVIQKESGGAS